MLEGREERRRSRAARAARGGLTLAFALGSLAACATADTTPPIGGDALTCTLGADPKYLTFEDALSAAHAGESFSQAPCGNYDYAAFSSGPTGIEKPFYDDATGLFAALVSYTEPTAAPTCAGPPTFFLPDCAIVLYTAVGARGCAGITFSGDGTCDACLNKSCCNELDYCTQAGTSCQAYESCLTSGAATSTCADTAPDGPLLDAALTACAAANCEDCLSPDAGTGGGGGAGTARRAPRHAP